MFIDPIDLYTHPDIVEDIEKASMRLVTQAIYDFRETAAEIFSREADLVADIGEDLTREALDRMGVSRINERLYGKIDYKRAKYVFHADYAVRQALFVDSKAEKIGGRDTATLQTAQTSLRIRHMRQLAPTDEPGTLPIVIEGPGLKHRYLTTSLFVKYNYDVDPIGTYELHDITVAALPNGMLQDRYNPDALDTIWRTGRNAPSRGEAFRVRLVFALLKTKNRWRVQNVPMPPNEFEWDE